MSVSDWIKVRDNPIQRDTERHAAKAKHLLTPLPIHAVVFAAQLPGGDLIKLDGHTRALMWKRNDVKHPPHVDVNVIKVDSVECAIELYKTFDSREALETATDKITGGFRKVGFKPDSALVASGAVTTSLKIAWVGVHGFGRDGQAHDIYEMVDEFAAEILALDEMGLRKGIAPSGVIAAVLLSYRKHNDRVLPFWRKVFGNAGTKVDGEMDGVQAVCELMQKAKSEKKYGGGSGYDMCSRTLRAVDYWLDGVTFRQAPRGVELGNYLETPAQRQPRFQLIKKVKRAAA